MKRADDTPRSKPHVERHARRLRKYQEVFGSPERDQRRSFNDIIGASDHHASQVADLLIESGRFPDRTEALHHILNTPSGQALLQRMHKADQTRTEKESHMRTSETLESILKDGGPVSVCKAIVDRGRSPCGEHELVTALTKAASEQHPEKSPAQAFAELYKTESVWRACAIAKAMPFQVDLQPVMVGGEDTRDLSDESKAIEQLKALGARRWPTASAADQFERALTAPENHVLARRAVPIPRATTSYPFPR